MTRRAVPLLLVGAVVVAARRTRCAWCGQRPELGRSTQQHREVDCPRSSPQHAAHDVMESTGVYVPPAWITEGESVWRRGQAPLVD